MSRANRGKSVTLTETEKYTIATEYSGSNLVYVGKAHPGTPKSENHWQIQKLSYDGSNNVTDVQWANGNKLFNKSWDNRASYTYS